MFERHFVLDSLGPGEKTEEPAETDPERPTDAGPQRRSTTTKLDMTRIKYSLSWRNQIRRRCFRLENIRDLSPQRMQLRSFRVIPQVHAEGRNGSPWLFMRSTWWRWDSIKKKLDRAEKNGRQPGNVTNSKFWYEEVRKKIQEVLEQEGARHQEGHRK